MAAGKQSAWNDTGNRGLALATYLGSDNPGAVLPAPWLAALTPPPREILQNEAKLSFRISKATSKDA